MTEQRNNQAETARERAIQSYEASRETRAESRGIADTFSEAPLIALAGGIAAGALIAALLPRTGRETSLVRPTARRVKETARAAYDAARETGSSRLQEAGISREKGKATIESLFEGVVDAAKASAGAAYDAARARD
jgi:hypothetical protein